MFSPPIYWGVHKATTMTNEIQSIALDKFVAHPDNPNRMSRANFTKLVRNIKQTGRYEPLVVRPCPDKLDYFQIINGHHRWKALEQLGYKSADAVVWDIDNKQTDILLATLNRLGGSDILDKKLALMKQLNRRMQTNELAKLLPQTAEQIERLTNLRMPSRLTPAATANCFANPLVFFVNDKQQQTIQNALSLVKEAQKERTKAAKNAAALTYIAQSFLNQSNNTGLKEM